MPATNQEYQAETYIVDTELLGQGDGYIAAALHAESMASLPDPLRSESTISEEEQNR